MAAINKTLRIDIALKEGAYHNVATLVTDDDDVLIDISGYTFEMNLLDKEGGTVLDAVTVSFVSDGTDGKYKEVFTDTELATLITAGTIPTWFEFFATTGAVPTKWYHGAVDLERAGG